jgi:hypothetical protein
LVVSVPSQSNVVVINVENLPSSVPATLVVASLPTTNVVYVATSIFVQPPTVVVVPSNWVSPVAVPASLVSSVSSSLVITVASSPSVVVINYSNLPLSIPTLAIAPIPSTNVITVPPTQFVQVPTIVRVPSTVFSPVVIPAQFAPNSNLVTVLPVFTSNAVIVARSEVPSNVPTAVIQTIPSSNIHSLQYSTPILQVHTLFLSTIPTYVPQTVVAHCLNVLSASAIPSSAALLA